MIGIYEIKNKLNNKIYIGSSVNIEKRWKDHKYYLNNNKHHSILLQNSWNLHKEENFEFNVLEEVLDVNNLISREQYYLDFYKSYTPEYGYNICSIANSILGYKYSEEQKKVMSQNRKGVLNQHYGKRHSEETKRKIGEKNKNRIINDDERKKRSIAMKEAMRRIKQENPEKFDKMTSFRNYSKGVKRSEETRKKISEAAKRRTAENATNAKLNYEMANLIRKEYISNDSIDFLAEKYNVSDTTIRDIILNKRWIK